MRLEYFQMIDGVDEFDADKATITARAQVPAKSPVFEGHFPGLPLVPGVLLIETMAQASGIMLYAAAGFEQMPFLASVKTAKIRTFVLPEARMIIKAVREHDGSGFAVTRAEIIVADNVVCNADLTFRFLDFPSAEVEEYIRGNARKLGLTVPDASAGEKTG
ncbi:3-hydroxyacyl-[acyl-carrier-protein] dehydratase, FabZ form [hydrothermal vent metagenome]|uniref:3-hydroxyacyl-[acyl-carrier-protein] dehydratase, FabZ form n=1 Tax=hydrothermal vent metagenome TaxID=652676 RepID=A0A3B0UFZ8_9ZZZZ